MSESTNHRRSLAELMGEASVLPTDDSQRQDVERRVAEGGPAAEEQWSAVLKETKVLRSAMQDLMPPVEPPKGLEQRLLGIAAPTTKPQPQTRLYWSATRWLVIGSASLIVLIAISGLLYYVLSSMHLETLAMLAINNHVNHIDDVVDVQTSDLATLEQSLSEQLPFPVVIPSLGEKCQLIGGRKCKLGTHPVSFSLWESPYGKLSLFQGRSEDFRLPRQSRPQRVHVRDAAVSKQLDTVMIWSDDGWVYVLVGDPKSALDHAVPQRESRNR